MLIVERETKIKLSTKDENICQAVLNFDDPN
jgi:hypothetical protein